MYAYFRAKKAATRAPKAGMLRRKERYSAHCCPLLLYQRDHIFGRRFRRSSSGLDKESSRGKHHLEIWRRKTENGMTAWESSRHKTHNFGAGKPPAC